MFERDVGRLVRALFAVYQMHGFSRWLTHADVSAGTDDATPVSMLVSCLLYTSDAAEKA